MGPQSVVTLVTEALAERGVKFRIKVHPRCVTCRLFTICVSNLRPGLEYEVLEIRSKKHVCPLTGSVMRVVKVRPLPLKVALPKRVAVEGVVLAYEPIKCDRRDCNYHRFCDNEALKRRERIKVVGVVETLQCPLGSPLVLAEVFPLSLLASSRTRT